MARKRRSNAVRHAPIIGASLVSAVVLAALCLANAGSAGDKKVVGATLLNLHSPYLVTVEEAMKVEAAKLDIDLVSLDSARNVTTELYQVENLIAKKVDLIVMVPVDQKASQTAAKLINEAGIPLVLLNTKFTDDFTFNGGKFVTYVGSEDTVAGEIQGQYLADKMPEGGNVAYLVIAYGISATEGRKAGFESVIKDHPNLRIVTELQGNASRAKGKTITEKILQKYGKGQLQAIVAQNDEMAIGASSAIQAADRLESSRCSSVSTVCSPRSTPLRLGISRRPSFRMQSGRARRSWSRPEKFWRAKPLGRRLMIPFKLITKENVSSFK